MFAGLIGAIAWNLATWYWGLPSSSSHALIGGVVGSAFVEGAASQGTPGVYTPFAEGAAHMVLDGDELVLHMSRLTYAVDAARSLFIGSLGDPAVLRGFGVLMVLALLALWWAARQFRQATA